MKLRLALVLGALLVLLRWQLLTRQPEPQPEPLPSALAARPGTGGGGTGASSFPRVFIVPLPADFNRGLLSCDRPSGEGWFARTHAGGGPRTAWFAGRADVARFGLTSAARPFGGGSRGGARFSYTAAHPSFESPTEGEYDQDVYFHTMLEGYVRRVRDPRDADLFYVPVYYRFRLACHPNASTHAGYTELLDQLGGVVDGWMRRFPPKRGPNFFTVSGAICSCFEVYRHLSCNPLHRRRDLDGRLRIVAWETPVLVPPAARHVVAPYVSQLHGVLPWDEREQRELLVLLIAGKARNQCVYCGPCATWVPIAPADKGRTCRRGCSNIRGALIKQLRRAAAVAKDVALWTPLDNPSAVWFPQGQRWWPPQSPQVYAHMLEATFCVQPAGDSLTRKGFYESILAGCIPVMFREDGQYLDQLAFSSTIPYRDLWIVVPADLDGGTNVVALLRKVSTDEIHKRRHAIKRWGRRLAFSASNRSEGGYNDLADPDAFASTLREVWRQSKV